MAISHVFLPIVYSKNLTSKVWNRRAATLQLVDKNHSTFAPNHTRTLRQRRYMSTPPHLRGSHGPLQRLCELPRPRVRLGDDFHGLRACECFEKMACTPPPPHIATARRGVRAVQPACSTARLR